MARLQDMKKEEMFGGTRGAKPGNDRPRGPDSQQIAKEVDKLEKDINELKSQYELYFMGVEKLEPLNARDLIKSELRRWQEAPGRNTAIKFKLQQLKARMVSLENYWSRINKLREAGLYKRDQERVRRRNEELAKKDAERLAKSGAPAGQATAEGAAPANTGKSITGAELHAGRSGAETRAVVPGAPKPAAPSTDNQRPSASSAEDLTEPKLRKLYQTYVSARKRCGEAVDLRYEDMAAALRKQVPKLMSTTGAKAVEFKVVIRSGRAVLKAVPK